MRLEVLDPDDKVTEHFRWAEVLWLQQWKVFVYPTKQQAKNLIKICKKLELVRKMFDAPLIITSGLRPGYYNSYIGGAKNSAHREGKAIDFIVKGFDTYSACNQVRNMIKPYLSDWKIRMENYSTSNWIHLDQKHVGPGGRFFKP